MSPYKFVNKILNTDEEIEYICSTLYKHIKQGRESKGNKLTLEQYTRITRLFDSINVASLLDTPLKIQVSGYTEPHCHSLQNLTCRFTLIYSFTM